MLPKQAELNAKLGKYIQALQMYEYLAKITIGTPTLKFQTKGYLTSACFCIIGAQVYFFIFFYFILFYLFIEKKKSKF